MKREGGSASITTATRADTLPPPVLSVSSRSRDHVTLVCRAPPGQQGVLFNLYRFRQKGSGEAEFRLSDEMAAAAAAADSQQQHYCCLYKNTMGLYSAFSPYLTLEQPPQPPPGAAPTASPVPPPSPVLSVEPPGGRVRRGQTLSFHCSLPAETQSQYGPRPLTFLLVKTALVSGETSLVLQPEANQMPNSMTPQLRAFSLGPVQGGEGGSYVCMYQFSSNRRRLVNSTVSNVIQVTVTDLLPRPTLTLQQQPGSLGVWHLSCRGSAAYPGSLFSLYRADSKQTVAAHQAPRSGHRTAFPIPVQDQETARYECRYSTLLGNHWSDSERSLPVEVTRGAGLSSSGVDWPLLAGSFSAVVLFMAVVLLVVFVVQRKGRKPSSGAEARGKIMWLVHPAAPSSTQHQLTISSTQQHQQHQQHPAAPSSTQQHPAAPSSTQQHPAAPNNSFTMFTTELKTTRPPNTRTELHTTVQDNLC
ncbi:hypothetical protein CRUP_019167 [Coryphaenoides rupestris]|nr:hypothetical protein CRUP_019167 [Coryphaenoides rupestris]